jgi:hypothetical protein
LPFAKANGKCIRLSFAIGECGALPIRAEAKWQLANAVCLSILTLKQNGKWPT